MNAEKLRGEQHNMLFFVGPLFAEKHTKGRNQVGRYLEYRARHDKSMFYSSWRLKSVFVYISNHPNLSLHTSTILGMPRSNSATWRFTTHTSAALGWGLAGKNPWRRSCKSPTWEQCTMCSEGNMNIGIALIICGYIILAIGTIRWL